MSTSYNHPGSETCPHCQGSLTVYVGPFGKNNMHFGKIGCVPCRKFVKWAPWPEDRDKLALAFNAKCKTCKAPIEWVQTRQGKRMPLDPKPFTVVTSEGDVVTGRTSHFATCPQAAAHHKAKTLAKKGA